MPTDFRSLPQSGSVYGGLTPRAIFTQQSAIQVQYYPSLSIIDGTKSRDTGSATPNLLRGGIILGKITATGKLRPAILGLTTAAAAKTDTTLTVPAAVATEIARLITAAGASVAIKVIGPTTTGGAVNTLSATVSAASGTTLTLAAALDATNGAVAGSLILPADGSQTPITILDTLYGIDMVARDGTSIDQRLDRYLRGADLVASMIVNLVSDDYGNTTEPSCQAWLKSQLIAAGQTFTFDNDR